MLRVISGEHGGRRLHTPAGLRTRPTADRVRQALFNILLPPPPGSVVLDLYAGTGALGIEALSRGAAQAVFVDDDKVACQVLRDNLRLLGLSGRATVLEQRVERVLPGLRKKMPPGSAPPYHYVFLDAPYREVTTVIPPVLRFFAAHAEALLAPGGTLVVEHDRHDDLDDLEALAPLGCTDVRRYGDTKLSFFSALVADALTPDLTPGGSP